MRKGPIDVMLGTLALQPRAGPLIMAPPAGMDAALLVPAPHGVVTEYPCLSMDALEVQPGAVRTQSPKRTGAWRLCSWLEISCYTKSLS